MPKLNMKGVLTIRNFFSYIILVFPKTSTLLLGGCLKFCFCKGLAFPILLIPIFISLLIILANCSQKEAFKIGFLFGFGYFLGTLYWIAESFKCVGFGNYGYLAVLCLVLYLSIYTGTACYLTKRLSTTRINFILFFAIFWTICEYLRGIIFTGFPWNLIGYTSYDIPYFAQIADIFGIYGVSFILILIIGLLSYRKTLLPACGILITLLSYGYYKTNLYDGYVTPDSESEVIIIQPSIPQEDKLVPSKFKKNIDTHLRLSNLNNRLYLGSRLVIWPEAAINTPIESGSDLLKYIASSIKNNNTYIVSGCDRFDEEKKLYNSLAIIDKNGEIQQFYDKRHLLPFGEFIPEFLLKLGLKKMTGGVINFSSGNLKRTIELPGVEPFDCVICYEIVFPGEILDNPNSKWILNITNDSWFKNSDGPTQHLKIACFRAIEEGRMIVRSANNGISAVIDCNGRLLQTLKTDVQGRIICKVPGKYHTTLFSKYKNLPIAIILILMFSYLIFTRTRTKTRAI